MSLFEKLLGVKDQLLKDDLVRRLIISTMLDNNDPDGRGCKYEFKLEGKLFIYAELICNCLYIDTTGSDTHNLVFCVISDYKTIFILNVNDYFDNREYRKFTDCENGYLAFLYKDSMSEILSSGSLYGTSFEWWEELVTIKKVVSCDDNLTFGMFLPKIAKRAIN
jgi:hypothetical protein